MTDETRETLTVLALELEKTAATCDRLDAESSTRSYRQHAARRRKEAAALRDVLTQRTCGTCRHWRRSWPNVAGSTTGTCSNVSALPFVGFLSTPPPAPTDEAAPDAVEGQCPRCGERDGTHAADCRDWRCDHCGHDRESHREGVASRLERDGHFHTCRAEVASPSPERCGYIHVDGWTCERADAT